MTAQACTHYSVFFPYSPQDFIPYNCILKFETSIFKLYICVWLGGKFTWFTLFMNGIWTTSLIQVRGMRV